MKLHSLKINGFRRIKEQTVFFGDASFLIGSNNSGKSSILRAIKHLLSGEKVISADEYYSEIDEETGEQKPVVDKIILEAEFRNVPTEAESWRGFKGRVFEYSDPPEGDTGLSIHYRKTYSFSKDVEFEMRSYKRELKEQFSTADTLQDYIDAGLDEELLSLISYDHSKKLNAFIKKKIAELDEIYDVLDEEEWFLNPGGIPGNVISRLPKFILIPADTNIDEINHKTGVLHKTLEELFKDVRDTSPNYQTAQTALTALARELDPDDETSEFGIMMDEINNVLKNVFPDSSIHALADLTDPNKALKPTFDISMASNIRTSVQLQGTGMIRSAAFALLRYRQKWLTTKSGEEQRSIIIGFEEPEIYLHPSAANQMRNTIYDLSNENSQIVATTHSPFMIDLSKRPRQVLNRFVAEGNESVITPFNVTDEFIKLQENDKSRVKMTLKMDEYVSRAFFTKKVILVEGDTEDIVIKEALVRLKNTDEEAYLRVLRDFEVIKARGKGTIISLVKYFKALSIDVFVIHDRDKGTEGAEIMNQPIADALGETSKRIMMEECIEDVLGYEAPTSNKPYRAYKETLKWGGQYVDVPESLRIILSHAFAGYLP